MTLQKRRGLFYLLVLIFFILGIGLILYANGWRLDFATLRLRKVGGIFVRSFPNDAKIYLDKKPVKNDSGFFQNGTLIGNLFPKNYELKMEADGYAPWREKVSVRPSLVAEEKYAVLVPLRPETVATGTIKNFWIIDGNIATENQVGILRMNGKKIGSGEILGITDDLEMILTKDAVRGVYFWNNVANQAGVNISAALRRANRKIADNATILVDETDGKKLIVLEPKTLSVFNTENTSITNLRILTKNIIVGAAASQFLLGWTEFNYNHNTSTLVIYDKFLNKRLDMIELKDKNAELRWIKNDEIAALQSDGSLYVYDTTKNELAKITTGVKSFSFSEDGSALAVLNQNALEVFFLDGEKDYYRFNLPKVNEAESVIWYADNNHLFVIYPQSVRFLDLKDTSLENFTTVAETNLAKYDKKNNLLYFLNEQGLEKLTFPR